MGAVKTSLKKIAEQQKKIGIEVKERTTAYVLAAFGFVVGLAWNDAIKSLIEYLFPLNKDNIFIKIFYAFFITIITVTFTIILTRKTEKEKIEIKE